MSDVLQFLTKVEFFKISLCQIMQVKGNKHEREKERATCPTDAVQTCWNKCILSSTKPPDEEMGGDIFRR